MGFFGAIKDKVLNEFIDIIEWTDDTNDTMVWRFPRYQSEIKNGAQLTVRETQVAVLVNEGQFADIYQPGRYELTTQNMPILSTLKGWKYGFNSPFKVDVYFVNTKQFLNLRWGTANPIMMRDAEFGRVRMRAFGSYCFRIQSDPTKFIKNVVGTDGNFTTDEVSEQLRNFVITKFTDYLAESKVPVLDMASNLNEFSAALTEALKDDFSEYGIDLTKFLIENISLPEAVEQALDKSTSLGIIGNQMNAYTQMSVADSFGNGGAGGGAGLAGDAMGAGIGLAMAQQMTQQMQQQQMQPQMGQMQQPMGQPQMAPPPMPQQPTFYVGINGAQQGPYQFAQLQQLVQSGQLTAQSMVWTQGMPAWAAAGTVPALAQLFVQNTPPPMPPMP